MGNGASLAGGGRSILLLVVLAAAAVAGFSGGNGGGGAVAMAGGAAVGTGIRGGPALRLGFWVDGTGHAGSHRSAAAVGRGGVLPLCAESDVPGLRSGMDRAVDWVRKRQRGGDGGGGGGCTRSEERRVG